MLACSLGTARANGPGTGDADRDGPRGGEPPVAITSDTRAFCDLLADRVRGAPRQTAETQHLLIQGETMCRTGAVRAGLFRLRQALLLEQHAGAMPRS